MKTQMDIFKHVRIGGNIAPMSSSFGFKRQTKIKRLEMEQPWWKRNNSVSSASEHNEKIPFFRPLNLQVRQTITQQRNPCSKHKHA